MTNSFCITIIIAFFISSVSAVAAPLNEREAITLEETSFFKTIRFPDIILLYAEKDAQRPAPGIFISKNEKGASAHFNFMGWFYVMTVTPQDNGPPRVDVYGRLMHGSLAVGEPTYFVDANNDGIEDCGAQRRYAIAHQGLWPLVIRQRSKNK